MTSSTVAPVSPPDAAAARSSATVVRRDIQGLRALAVGLVLVFHLWPLGLTGGFVGVDVFFVISGFLITSHLLAHPPGQVRDLLGFWARRIQRLLPASLLVLACTVVATRLVAPETLWSDTADDVEAAALYLVNWRLADLSVDYLAAEAAPSPVQHFWSLSIEEQFYAGWPVLVLLLFVLVRRARLGQVRVVVAGLAATAAVSLLYSVLATAAEPARAYFITPTRIWELALGGLLAALLSGRAFGRDVDDGAVRLPAGARVAMAWAGLAAIVWSALTYDSATPFPGWLALAPVLGTVAVIAANAPAVAPSPVLAPASPRWVLGLGPVQFLGNTSYSVYLWHWPLIVLVPYATGHPLSLAEKLAILVATVILAALTKTHVEDRFRHPRHRRPLVKPFLAAAAGMTVVVALAWGLQTWFEQRQAQARADLARAVAGDDPCFGALALAPDADCAPADGGSVVPAPAEAIEDKSDAYGRGCWEYIPFDSIRTCTFGDPDGRVSIALVGNSHAGHWLPAVQAVAERRGWRITTFLASECTATTVPVSFDTVDKTDGCLAWGQRVLDATASRRFDLVVTAERNGRPVAGSAEGTDQQPLWQEGYRRFLQQWQDQGQHVLVLHDTPFPAATGINPPECVAQHPDDFAACAGPRDDWLPRDPLLAAARSLDDPTVSSVDLSDRLCGPDVCPAVIGGVLVYFDGSHISATYSRTLAAYLDAPLARAVDRAR